MRFRYYLAAAAAALVPALALAAVEVYGDNTVALLVEEEEMPLELSAAARELPAGAKVALMELDGGPFIEIHLLVDETPETAGNFIDLVGDGFYDGITFHRVVPGFVIQAGDATLVGRENPDISLEVEADAHKCVRGAVSMARLARRDEDTGEMIYGDTSPTQFFILTGDSPHLEPDFCVFGVVVNGMDAVDAVKQGDVIERVRVLTVGAAGETPTTVED
jgi:peptidyl-prolyl cis-trans isomerase B (cyclophilin B)